jgi:3-isopropylmalate dehydratase small subunit
VRTLHLQVQQFLSIENVDTDQIIPARFKQQSVLVSATTFSRLAIQQ